MPKTMTEPGYLRRGGRHSSIQAESVETRKPSGTDGDSTLTQVRSLFSWPPGACLLRPSQYRRQPARHAFDHKEVGNSRLVRAPAASHDRQSLDLEKVSAQRAGNETDDAMANGSEAVVMQRSSREMGAGEDVGRRKFMSGAGLAAAGAAVTSMVFPAATNAANADPSSPLAAIRPVDDGTALPRRARQAGAQQDRQTRRKRIVRRTDRVRDHARLSTWLQRSWSPLRWWVTCRDIRRRAANSKGFHSRRDDVDVG
jgi:hypothetical protein